jgi:hypothetical protein
VVINLALVLVDGSTPIVGTGLPLQQNWTAPQGVDVTFNGTLLGSNGAPINISTYTNLLLTIRNSGSSGISTTITVLTGSIVSGAAGTMLWTLPGATTRILQQSYYYDVFVTNAAGKRDEVLPMSFCSFPNAPGA